MASVHASPASVNPGIERLSTWLEDQGYPTEAIGRIRLYVAEEGTPTGAPDLDRKDEEWAEHEFVEGLPPVAGVAPEWDEHASEPGYGPVYQTVGTDFVFDHMAWDLERLQNALADTEEVPAPVSGGAPTAEDAIDTLRRWYRKRESFADWLESQGGIAWEEE